MSRLPVIGSDSDSWGSLLNDFLRQALDSDGTLLTSPTNPHTGGTNTNLANSSRLGLVQLTGDLGLPNTAPKVTGLQGRTVAATAPTDGQVLAWNTSNDNWQPTNASGGGVTRAQVMAMASMRI